MLLPIGPKTIFRNRWLTLLWAFGICVSATEIVDSLTAYHDGNVNTQAADEDAPPAASP